MNELSLDENHMKSMLPQLVLPNMARDLLETMPKSVYKKDIRISPSGMRLKSVLYLVPPHRELSKLRVDYSIGKAGLYVPSLNLSDHTMSAVAHGTYDTLRNFLEKTYEVKLFPVERFSESSLDNHEFDKDGWESFEHILKRIEDTKSV